VSVVVCAADHTDVRRTWFPCNVAAGKMKPAAANVTADPPRNAGLRFPAVNRVTLCKLRRLKEITLERPFDAWFHHSFIFSVADVRC